MGVLLAFLFKKSRAIVIAAIIASILSGIASSTLIGLSHRALATREASPLWLMLGFAALCFIFPLSRVVAEVLLVNLSQKVVFDLRAQFIRQIVATPLRKLEEIKTHRIMAALTDDVAALSNGLATVPILFLQFSVLLGCVIYLGYLYIPLLIVTVIVIPLGIACVQLFFKFGLRHFIRARKEQDMMFKHIRAVAEGVKLFKLHRGRRDAFMNDLFTPTGLRYRHENVRGNAVLIGGSSIGTSFFFVTLGLFLFVAPRLIAISPQVLTGYVLVFGFLMVPIGVITSLMSNIGRANVALRNIRSLGIELGGENDLAPLPLPRVNGHSPKLEFESVTHAYTAEDQTGFTLGPIDLSIEPGELVFVVGGNGSGKTTLAKVITGLYQPQSGQVRFNGQIVTERNHEDYREHFTAVFSDFFLFENLLGLEHHEIDEQAREYLKHLRLDHKVTVENGVLSTIDLSNGQRKRLALLTAYLEDRPIYLFDEWAADQDPVFKNFFYRQILPELKQRGKTVFVITHDDQYYGVADRLIKLDYGQISHDSLSSPPPDTRELSENSKSAPEFQVI
ncbi:MAG TPA: cyclic peptide export ABC transporter [Pyrinomonadaceae bacterium]|nr:cyclic peptide export ABC transporter [Pyrinomonadaceae bacterium]